MKKLYDGLGEDLKSQNFELLPEVHATSAGLKAFTTWIAADGIEECRRACGGHGYSKFSALPTLFANYVPAVTFEGDNYVLVQQTARYLIKSLKYQYSHVSNTISVLLRLVKV
jgi:acyl-CoA oxidase